MFESVAFVPFARRCKFCFGRCLQVADDAATVGLATAFCKKEKQAISPYLPSGAAMLTLLMVRVALSIWPASRSGTAGRLWSIACSMAMR